MNDKIKDERLRDVLAGSPDWMWAVYKVVKYWIEQNLCFSSGEVVQVFALHRPNMNHDVVEVGHFLHFLHATGKLPHYFCVTGSLPYPSYTYPVQERRVTEGRYASPPVDVKVWVYGPDRESAESYDFEVPLLGLPE